MTGQGLQRRPPCRYDEQVSQATTIEEQVRQALEIIRPAIQLDGGDIEFHGVQDGVVTVMLLGTCESCPISPVTLKQGVERLLRERVPGVTEVVAIEA
jgi:Fe-S cluster biogenesis protein NfuA